MSTIPSSSSPKASKLPRPAPAAAQNAETSTPKVAKAKSAKELKKEKRAAQVAQRGGNDERPDTISPNIGTSTIKPRQTPGHNPTTTSSTSNPTNPTGGTSDPRPPTRRQVEPNQSHHQPHSNLGITASFFSHLPIHKTPSTSNALNSSKIHPIIIRLGVLMSSGVLRGANARTMGMMEGFKEVIRDYEVPERGVLWKDLPVHLSPMIAWLEGCRPKGVGGGNAIRWLKSEINKLGEEGGEGERTEVEQKALLIEAIGYYIRDRIEFADQVIADNAKEKIKPGDTVVVYARSSVVERVLLEAWRDMKAQDESLTFNVIVVDSRPLHEGRALLSSLTSQSLPCTYILLPLLSSLLPRASLILLGAAALHSDGSLYSRAGTALIAMLAKEHRVPVVACVETYKFGEKVVLDAVASNELGDVEDLLKIPYDQSGKDGGGGGGGGGGNITPLHLLYDLTPPSLITAVCTEIGFIPPSSVPTVLGKASGGA